MIVPREVNEHDFVTVKDDFLLSFVVECSTAAKMGGITWRIGQRPSLRCRPFPSAELARRSQVALNGWGWVRRGRVPSLCTSP